MKLLLALTLLVPSLAWGVEPQAKDGRYQFVNTSGRDFIIDTKTGKIWERKVISKDMQQTVFTPAFFIKDEYQEPSSWKLGLTPEGPYSLQLDIPNTRPRQ